MFDRHFGRWVRCATVGLFGIASALPARAAPCNFEETAFHDVMPGATIINVYWSSNWDAGAPPELTRAAIDSFTQALVDSRYFDSANANYGSAQHPVFGGSIQYSTIAPPAAHVDIPFMSNVVNAALRDPAISAVPSPVVNLFVAVGTLPRNMLNQDCPNGGFGAFHTKANLTNTPFTVLPIDPSCGNTMLSNISDVMSHELVETVTDPGGEGYMHNFDPGDEIADACQAKGAFSTSPVSFLLTTLDTYFADDVCGCVPAPPPADVDFSPLELVSTNTGSTLHMFLVGTGLWHLPSRITLPTTMNTPYLQLSVRRGSTDLSAGNSLNEGGDATLVTIDSFGPFGVGASVDASFLEACDLLDLKVWNPVDGAMAHAMTQFGSASSIAFDLPLLANQPLQTLSGRVLDGHGIGVPGVVVTFITTAGVAIPSVRSAMDGRFIATFVDPSPAQLDVIASTMSCNGATINAPVTLKRVTIAPASGPMQGGTAVVISGPSGFSTNAVTFGSKGGTNVSCIPAMCVAYTPAQDPQSVPVTVGPNLVADTPFTYLGPQITSVVPSSGPVTGGTLVHIHGVNIAGPSSFLAPVSFGGLSSGSASCSRSGSQADADCSVVTPAVGIVGPFHVQLTMTNATGTQVLTPFAPSDVFTFSQLPSVSALEFPSGGGFGGTTVTGIVRLNGNAPAGATVALALIPGAPAGIIGLPPPVMVNAGWTYAIFPVAITGLSYSGTIDVIATYAGTSVTATLQVLPTPAPTLDAVGTLCGAQMVTETITLAEPAPVGGGVVSLATDNAAASVPATVVVPAGATTATFTVTTSVPSSATIVHLDASYVGIAANTVTFSVQPAAALVLGVPPAIVGGQTVTGSVTICTPAPAGGTTVALTANSPVTLPASVPIAAGAMSASFSVTARPTSTNQVATIVATTPQSMATESVLVEFNICPARTRICDCDDGRRACLANATQCMNFCTPIN